MTSSRRRPGAKRGFRPRASRTTHRRHAVVVGGPERRCRPLPPHRGPRGVAGRRNATAGRRRAVDPTGESRRDREGSGSTPSPSYLPGSADLVLAESEETTSAARVVRGVQMKEPRLTACRWVISTASASRGWGDESTGNGPAGHHKQPGARLRASGVHGGAGGQGVHALVRGPSVIQPPTAPPFTPRSPRLPCQTR